MLITLRGQWVNNDAPLGLKFNESPNVCLKLEELNSSQICLSLLYAK